MRVRALWWVVMAGVIGLMTACAGEALDSSPVSQAPTVSSLFDGGALTTSRPRPTAPAAPTRTPRPAATPAVSSQAAPRTAGSAESQTVEVMIYDEDLHPDWSLGESWGVEVDLLARTHVQTGTVAVSVTPLEDYCGLLFSVKPDAQSTYPVTSVLGVSLWLNGGEDVLLPDDLAVTVIGSNAHTYYVKDDRSVQIDDRHFFSESRLSYLGITRSVRPDTWVEATVFLDKLPYEPDYQYVTGVYIKNDEGYRQTYYVDRVALLMIR